MSLGLSYFSSETQPSTLQPVVERCIRALSTVAAGWVLLGAVVSVFSLNDSQSPEMHARFKMLQIGSLLVAAGLYSVILPVYYILRSEARARS